MEGDRALVGNPGESCDAGGNCGAAYVLDYDGASWNATRLLPTDQNWDNHFGQSVALSGDRVLIGARGERCGDGTECGAAYVFDFDGSTWQGTKVVPIDRGVDFRVGHAVALEGDRAVVGSGQSAYVFDFDGEDWLEATRFTVADASGVQFGYAVALSGSRVLVGADREDCDVSLWCGAVYVYDHSDTGWIETKLEASDMVPDWGGRFGYSVALEGDRALVGALSGQCSTGTCGAAYAYDLEGGLWRETRLVASDEKHGDRFGRSVALSGSCALVGAYGVGCAQGNGCGAAYLYDFTQEVTAFGATSPEALSLLAPMPNPASGAVTLNYTLPAPGEASLVIYDALGREVAVAALGLHTAGAHTAQFDARSLTPGVYMARLASGGATSVQRFTVSR
ncbi:T9SS type A sorting domain-containing protein [Rubricoccus marinus]|uniref:T9SS type A sorting domain-containing protein n=1 Tax=Rubricoccus marinus TaxID=716817 RepID=UPI0015C5C65C